MKSKKFITDKEIVLNHPYINDCLVFDIETDSLDVNNAKCKFFGAYSYKYQKYYILHEHEKESIQKLLDEHKVLIGWNIKSFDCPILENEHNNYNINFKIILDGLRVLYNPDTHINNRKSIIKLKSGQHLDAVCKSNSLKNIGMALGCTINKGDIDYKIFQKNSWSDAELKEIETYLYYDIELTRQVFEYLLEYFDSFKDLVPEDDVRKFNYIRSSTGSFAYSVISKAIGKKPLYPDNKNKLKHKKFEGGYVLEPTKEYAENVIYWDFASLYPNIQFMCNLFSPITTENVKVWNGNGFFQTFGTYNSEKQGVIEQELKNMYLIRQKLKQENNPQELGYKITINSIYGNSANPIFLNVYNETIGPDTTWIGRQILQHSIRYFNYKGLNVIAADTDSCFIELGNNTKEYAIKIANEISEEIKSNVPFPSETFKLKIDAEIKKIYFPGKKKKNYAYIDNYGKLHITGLSFIKSDATLLGQKMFQYLKPLIEEKGDIKFSKEFLKEKTMEFIKEDLRLVGRVYRVRKPSSYKNNSSIQAQIAEKYGEGEYLMIPNKEIGDIGKHNKYCLEDEVHDLDINDLILDKYWKEMEVFTEDYYDEKEYEKSIKQYEKTKAKELQQYLDSDLFDSESVGYDISKEEFFENEKWFEVND